MAVFEISQGTLLVRLPMGTSPSRSDEEGPSTRPHFALTFHCSTGASAEKNTREQINRKHEWWLASRQATSAAGQGSLQCRSFRPHLLHEQAAVLPDMSNSTTTSRGKEKMSRIFIGSLGSQRHQSNNSEEQLHAMPDQRTSCRLTRIAHDLFHSRDRRWKMRITLG